MQLYIDSYGAFLGVRNGMFWVKPRNSEGRAIAHRQVKAVFLTRGVTVSADALLLAIREEVPVLLIDGIGRPAGQVWNGRFGSIATIRKNQALFANDAEGLGWVRDLLVRRLTQQRGALQQLAEAGRPGSDWRPSYQEAMRLSVAMERQFTGWKYVDGQIGAEIRDSFRGWEGTASRYYYNALTGALPAGMAVGPRSRRPALDPFNALLNYLFGMLYPMVELSLMKAGLDPAVGILHADEYNRPTLVFDLIEAYRHWAEWVAVDLCRTGRLPGDAFRTDEQGGVFLDDPGKDIAIPAFLAYLEDRESRNDKQLRRSTHIDLDAVELAGRLKTFRPKNLLLP